MRVPLSWLKEYIDLDMPSAEISDVLTMAGLEVDAVEAVRPSFEKVVVVRVLSTQQHPDADRLCIASVTDGADTYEVVCGAPNCREGLVTAYAPVGAKVQDDKGKAVKVRKSKIRGVESPGMLCSGKELGLSEESEGILELADDSELGADLAQWYSDEVFDISLTPNLAHCMSVVGVARELSAATGAPVRLPESQLEEDADTSVHTRATVLVADKEKCPRYTCRVIEGVSLVPSPAWMQRRLELSGIRSINNIVDITNYVLLEMGHPLHAFDYDKVAGHRIEVRCAQAGERFVTLDDVGRELTDDSLLICDADKAVALGGVMGGLNSEVSNQTVNVLLESAYFEPRNIRRTSRRLGLLTESSSRFERGCDPNNVIPALDRAAALMQQLAGGRVCSGIIDVKDHDFPEKVIACRLSRINDILGTQVALGEVEKIFQRLGFQCQWDGEDVLSVQVPTYRADVAEEIDLIEEVARIHGYNNIPREKVQYQSSRLPHTPMFVFEREMRARLMGEGLQEFMTSDLISPRMADVIADDVFPKAAVVEVINPTSKEQSIVRPSLLSGLLQVVKYNIDHQTRDVSGFEIGRIYGKQEGKYGEQSMAAIVLSGRREPRQWGEEACEVDFYDMKGMVENIVRGVGVSDFSFANGDLSVFHPGRQATLAAEGLELGVLGEVHPTILRKLDITQRVFFAVLRLQDMLNLKKGDRQMVSLSAFPGSERDWTLTLEEKIPVADVFNAIQAAAVPLLEEITLLDVYRSEKVGADHKNVTFRFFYRDRKKTVSLEAVEKQHGRLVTTVLAALGNTAQAS